MGPCVVWLVGLFVATPRHPTRNRYRGTGSAAPTRIISHSRIAEVRRATDTIVHATPPAVPLAPAVFVALCLKPQRQGGACGVLPMQRQCGSRRPPGGNGDAGKASHLSTTAADSPGGLWQSHSIRSDASTMGRALMECSMMLGLAASCRAGPGAAPLLSRTPVLAD